MRARPATLAVLVLSLASALSLPAHADLADAKKFFNTGKYTDCIDACTKAIDGNDWAESWWVLKIRSQLTTGRYADALKTYEEAQQRQPQSVRVRLIGIDVLRANDHPEDAAALPGQIAQMVQDQPWRYPDAADRVAVGRALLIGGVDARKVLEQLYDRAKKDNPDAPESYLASGDLALEKDDYALAAESFDAAAKHAADDPDVYVGLAKATENDSQRATAALNKALELNPRHIGALLMQADNAIDQESYDDARDILKGVIDINPHEPRAWSYRAVLAALAGDRAQEQSARDEALGSWHTNPEVDHLIGKKLSQKYRFAEGQTFQRQSLAFDPAYRPAKVQLCQDLLRLGQEDDGWRLADEVFKDDPYNVLSFNLITLRDSMAKFTDLRNPQFLVKMDPREAQIYGPRVQKLLARARQTLCAKYGVDLPQTITVEIFPQLKDFAIRTFGMPGGAGYLGVCFGNVITTNSPASRPGHPANWEAVLWHEFCHVVTLNKTHNKMPRWLSEGISVYEEVQENPAWGQRMTPQYRELILAHGDTPVSKLSGAFMQSDPMKIQFAYYESSMVVRYVVKRFGQPALLQVLTDLAGDASMNDALARRTEGMDRLDADFARWLRDQADHLAPDADWERPELPLDAGSAALAAWDEEHPKSFYGQLALGQALVAEQKWSDAKVPLERAAALYPAYAEVGGPYVLLAAVYRGLGDSSLERAMLEKHALLNTDAVEARLRLLEILTAAKDWPAVKKYAEQVLAVNPLIAAPHRYFADAAEALGERNVAIDADRILLTMDPADLADRHFRLARLLKEDGQLDEAHREVIRALEEAPRFRDAHKLLLQIVAQLPQSPPAAPTTQEVR